MMWEYLTILSWIGSVLTVLALVSMVGFTWGIRSERRAIKDLVPSEPATDRSKFAFLLKSNDEAESLRLVGPEWYEDSTGLLGRAKYALWRSSDNKVLMLIAQSRTLMTYEKIILLSRIDDRYVLKTVNGRGESDLLGYFEQLVKSGGAPLELMAMHLGRLDQIGTPIPDMPAIPVLLEYEAIERERVQRMVDKGLAVWLEGDNEPWRCTWLGAFLGYLYSIRIHFWPTIFEAFKEGMKEENEPDEKHNEELRSNRRPFEEQKQYGEGS